MEAAGDIKLVEATPGILDGAEGTEQVEATV